MKHLFIVNPVAGGRDSSERVAALAAEALPDGYELYKTTGTGDATRRVRQAAEQGEATRVYACGGDGTFSECVAGAVHAENLAVTHFPCGTGNDFIKMFGAEAALFSDLAHLTDGETHPLDVIACNDRISINICSVGIDARIGVDVHKYSSLPLVGGKAAYVVSTIVNFIKGINRPLRVTAAGQHFAGGMVLVCACNGCYYGGSFHPAPDARPDDGQLDILVIRRASRLTFLRVVFPYAKGHAARFPQYITQLRGTELHIEADEDFVAQLDGEPMHCRDLTLRVLPGAVNFLCPRGMNFFR